MTMKKSMTAHYVSILQHARCDSTIGYYPIRTLIEPKIVGRGQTAQLAWYSNQN